MSTLAPFDYLRESFTSEKPNIKDQYWHWILKNKTSESFYAKDQELQTKIEQYGRELLEKAGPHGWTPLHVACLQGNAPGAAYLLRQKVLTDVTDEFGNTPQVYANKHPAIGAVFQRIHPPIAPDFKSEDDAPPLFTAMANTDDFGTIVEQLHFSGNPIQNITHGRSIAHITENMKEIAEAEGVEISFAKPSYFLRDHMICLPDGTMVSGNSHDHELITRAREKAFSRSVYFNEHPSRCRHLSFQGTLGSANHLESTERSLFDFDSLYGTQRNEFRFFIEGGDLFTLTNNKGERTVIIGKDQLFMIHAECRLRKLFDDPAITLDIDGIELTDELTRSTAEEMFAMGLLNIGPNKSSGFIDDERLGKIQHVVVDMGKEDFTPYRDIAVEHGILPRFQLSAHDLQAVKPIVKKYLAQRKIVLELISKSLGISQKNLHFIPNAAYHLDVFLMPGPRGSIFIQDYALCEQVLTSLLKKSDTLQLSRDEHAILICYLMTAQTLKERLTPLLIHAREELARAGFKVIPVPGAFYDHSWLYHQIKEPKNHVNFMNAISGFSPKNRRPYLITTGAQIGSQLGTLLMQEFERAILEHQPNLKVYFVGKNPKTNDYSEAMMLWNGKDQIEELNAMLAGVRCLSKELRTTSHSY